MEEMNKQELERLCTQHGFSYTEMGIYIQIKSRIDTYYILNCDHEGRRITLYHQNNIGNARIHPHKTHINLKCLFWEIQWHDNRYTNTQKRYKQNRTMMMFDQIQLQYA